MLGLGDGMMRYEDSRPWDFRSIMVISYKYIYSIKLRQQPINAKCGQRRAEGKGMNENVELASTFSSLCSDALKLAVFQTVKKKVVIIIELRCYENTYFDHFLCHIAQPYLAFQSQILRWLCNYWQVNNIALLKQLNLTPAANVGGKATRILKTLLIN